MKRKPVPIRDFRGGYSDLLPDSMMPDSILREAENIYWKSGLRKRGGFSVSDALTAGALSGVSISNIRGKIRARLDPDGTPTYYTILAIDDGTTVEFYYKSTAWTKVTVGWTKDTDVQFAELGGVVVAVNGKNDPHVLYFDSTFQNKTLDEYDTRTRDSSEWWAGQFDDSATTYTDDTADARSTTADDFDLSAGAADDGFYVACVFTFNQVKLHNLSATVTPGAITAKYYSNGSWVTCGTVTASGSWSGDQILTWDYPIDDDDPWTKVAGDETWIDESTYSNSNVVNRWMVRITFANAVGQSCDYLEVFHTQYITQILGGDIPQAVVSHRNRLYLAAGNAVNISRVNVLTDWNEYDVEYFRGGGDEVKQMVSFGEMLIILKPGKMFKLLGTSFDNRIVEDGPLVGSKYARSAAHVGDYLFFLTSEGVQIYDGNRLIRVTQHVTLNSSGDVSGINYKGDYWLAIDDELYRMDPDTFVADQTDDIGEGRVAVWKYTGITFGLLEWNNGGDDNGYLICASNGTTKQLYRLENGNPYDLADTAIDCEMKTKDFDFGDYLWPKNFSALKIEIEKAGDYTLTLYAEHESQSATETVSPGTGGGEYTHYASVPYNLDGKNFAIYLRNNTVNAMKIYGFAVASGRRAY